MRSLGVKAIYLPAVTVFAGSFLLFLIQPVMGRTLLPAFGGSASVWLICLASWQTLLLAGSFYAHCFRAGGKRVNRHLSLLVLSAFVILGVTFFRSGFLAFIQENFSGSVGVFAGIIVFAAFPYVLLAAGSSLVQAWLSSGGRRGDVYHLYAVSNAGSFCGLFCYPFLIEPFISVRWQWYGFALLLLAYGVLLKKLSGREFTPESSGGACAAEPVRNVRRWTWFALPALSCFLLNAVIAHMFVDVTPLPLIWVFFVGCFLLSYVTGFSRLGATWPALWFLLSLVSLAAAIFARKFVGTGSLLINGVSAACVLFFFGTWLHRRVYENRPESARLTHYYLALTAGGACGGVLASVVAPVVFDSVFEYPLALALGACMLIALPLKKLAFFRERPYPYRILLVLWALAVCGFTYNNTRRTGSRVIYSKRNFYGVLRVTQTREVVGKENYVPVNYIWSGQTTHGLQIRQGAMRNRPNSYYGETGGGIAVIAHPRYRSGQSLTVGVVGLGAGSMACYGRASDLYRFYEINPDVIDVAGNPDLFSYLSDSRAAVDLIEGDARRMLEIEKAAGDPLYDVLMIDAYSGDAVPSHLATKEAFELYFSRLKEDGILALHVSNWHIDLLPLCKAAARHCGAVPYGVVGLRENQHTNPSIWVFMTRRPFDWRYPMSSQVQEVDWPLVPDMKLPEDDCGSLISLIRWR